MNERIPMMWDRELRPEWVDFALEQFVRTSSPEELRDALRKRLSPEIDTPTTLRKTISQLEQTVGYRSPLSREQLVKIHKQMSKLPSDQRGAIRLKLLVDCNKFLADCVAAIRKLHRVGVEGIQSQQLYDRLSDLYGERGSIPRRVRYVLRTLANMGLLENRDKKWFVVGTLL